MKIKYKLIILFAISISTLLQGQESEYSQNVKTCLNNELFSDFNYRHKHEKECFIGLKAPKFSTIDINGNTIDSSVTAEKVVVLNFWFTSCPPCLAEIPGLNQVKEKYKDEDVVFLAPCNESKSEIEEFFSKKSYNYDFNIIPDGFSLFRDTFLTKSGFPTTIVIDKKGVIRDYFSGGPASRLAIELIREKLEPTIDLLLKE